MALGEGEEGSLAKKVRDALKDVRDGAGVIDADPDGFDKLVADATRALREATGEFGDIELHISTNRITVGEQVVYKSEARDNNLAFDMFRQGLRRLTFKPGLSDDEVRAFMTLFAECRSADQIDEDFVSTLWQESLPNIHYVAIDGFTEKIFMSEQRFLAEFNGAIEEVMPGLLEMSEDDPGDRQPRAREEADPEDVVTRCETRDLSLRKQIKESDGATARALINDAADEITAFDHLIHLLGCLAVKHPTPLGDDELHDYVLEVLKAYLDREAWQPFTDAVRSLRQLVDGADAFDEAVSERLRSLVDAVAGRRLLQLVGERLDPEQTDFTAWVRWHFVSAEHLTAPDILQAVNNIENQSGKDLLKELLRRQGTASLDPWAERLKDPNPGVVLEVLDVILGSDLGEQARPLLLDTLKHDDGAVRARAVEGLFGAYDLSVREALLPHLKDPDTRVRRAVVTRCTSAGDKSISPYLASTVKSDIFFTFDEDEQRLYFESLARLGGERFLDVFEERLELEGGGGGLAGLFKRGSDTVVDNPTRRAVVSGLGVMGGRQALALIRKVHGKADLELAAHCDVVLRLSARGEARGEAPELAPPKKAPPLEDVGVGQTRMGDRVIFDLDQVRRAPPVRRRPTAEAVTQAAAGTLPPHDTVPSAPPPRPPGERPLLGNAEVFLPDDRRKLKAEPAVSEGPRFRLTSARAVLVGVPSAEAQSHVVQPAKAVVPHRVVERSASPSIQTDWHHQPEASLEDILSSYLTEEMPSTPPSSPVRPRTEPPRAPARPLTDPPRAKGRPLTEPPREVFAAPPADAPSPILADTDLLPALEAPPDLGDADADTDLLPELQAPADPAGREKKQDIPTDETVDDLLKDFLDLDLGD